MTVTISPRIFFPLPRFTWREERGEEEGEREGGGSKSKGKSREWKRAKSDSHMTITCTYNQISQARP